MSEFSRQRCPYVSIVCNLVVLANIDSALTRLLLVLGSEEIVVAFSPVSLSAAAVID